MDQLYWRSRNLASIVSWKLSKYFLVSYSGASGSLNFMRVSSVTTSPRVCSM